MNLKNKNVLWIVVGVFIIGGIALYAMSSQPTVVPAGATAQQAIEFESYYKDKMPLKYEIWKTSAHGENGVTCINCHGTELIDEKDLKYANFAKVSPETCGECHTEALDGFNKTRHVQAVSFSQNNVRFKLLDAFPEMQQQGCDDCHTKVEETCTSCHQGHPTALPKPVLQALPGQAVTGNFTNGCENCHMGPDHPQREAYESSVHFQVAQATGEPTCNTCHTSQDNNHYIIQLKNEDGEAGKNELWSNCLQCHSEEYVQDSRNNVEAIKKETLRIVGAARTIIRDLYKDGVLKPSEGSLLDKDGLPPLTAKFFGYSHESDIESLMFELHKYAEATTIKGAQHFSPDYTHWHGFAELWAKYLAIKGEAERLYLEAGVKDKLQIEAIELPMYTYPNATGHELDSLRK
ncbi:MAG: hypothetical protein VR72_19660 [Clostridiaceae bacterium BRH_c20a]|nr:MAG: hypothetical protein VR72_19660 [Clostridiaceae bacterium BRH_c20a]